MNIRRMRRNTYIIGLLIVLLALFLRLIYLETIPSGISGDELDYVFTAKSVWLTGHDVTGTWSPFSLTTPPHEMPKAELPYMLIAPIVGPLPFSLFAARLPYVLFSILLVVSVIGIATMLFNKKVGLVSGFLMAINPWSIYMARTAFDAPVATSLMYFGILLLFILKKWRLLFALPFFFASFYSYIGMKAAFLPFVIVAIVGSYFILGKKDKTPRIVFLGLSILLFTIYIFSLHNNPAGSRQSELFTPHSTSNVQMVNNKRRLTLTNPASEIFVNKYTEYIRDRTQVAMMFFSPQYLFLYGDGRSSFSVHEHGILYIVDSVFLLAGLYILIRKKRGTLAYLLLLLGAGLIPTIASSVGVTYSIRANLSIPILAILTAVGISHGISLVQKKRQHITTIVIVVVYCLLTINFMYIYLLRNPFYNSEGLSFSNRIVSRYIQSALENNQNVVIINPGSTHDPERIRDWMFFYNKLSRKSLPNYARVLSGETNSFENITVITCKEFETLPEDAVVITTQDGLCGTEEKGVEYINIAQLKDGGALYKIYNDTICASYELSAYPSNISMDDLRIESLSNKDFCESFITDFSVINPKNTSTEASKPETDLSI